MAGRDPRRGSPPSKYAFGHGDDVLELNEFQGPNRPSPEDNLRRVTLQMVERIRSGNVGSVFNGGQVWTAAYLTNTDKIVIQNNPLNNTYVGLAASTYPEGDEVLFHTMNLDQLANVYSRVQPADARKPEEPNEKDFENLRFVSRTANEIPRYHYWVVPERGDKETPNLDNASITEMPASPGFQEHRLTEQQLEARAIDESAADRQHDELKRRFDQTLSLPDRRLHPPRCFKGQIGKRMGNEINPRSQEFEEALEYYCNALQKIPDNMSIYDWMTQEFSQERIYLLDASIHKGLQDIQAEQTKLYRELLRDESFRQLKSNAVLKFTMAYFGLPIQPLLSKDLKDARKGETPKTGLRDANAFDTDGDDEAEDGIYGSKIIWYTEKPLEFLDTYHERNLGFPMLRRKLNPYYKPSTTNVSQKGGGTVVRLRGGAGNPPSEPSDLVMLYCNGVRRGVANDFENVKNITKAFLGDEFGKENRFFFDIITLDGPVSNTSLKKVEDEPLSESVQVWELGPFDWDNFTQDYFEQHIQQPSLGANYVCRVRDTRSGLDKRSALFPGTEEGDVITLRHQPSQAGDLVPVVRFTIDDLESFGNFTSFRTQHLFRMALIKLCLPYSPQHKDFQWSIRALPEVPAGVFRFDQSNFVTPQFRKALRAIKGATGHMRLKGWFDLIPLQDDPNSIKIIIPGYAGLHSFPASEDPVRDYTAVPDEVGAAISYKVKGAPIAALRVWPSFESWDNPDPLTGKLNPGEAWPLQKGAVPGQEFSGWKLLQRSLLTNPGSSAIVVKPHFERFTLKDGTTNASEPLADQPLSSQVGYWTPSGPVPSRTDINEFWRQVDEVYKPEKPKYVRIKHLYDETMSDHISRDYHERPFKLLIFDTLDSATIWLEPTWDEKKVTFDIPGQKVMRGTQPVQPTPPTVETIDEDKMDVDDDELDIARRMIEFRGDGASDLPPPTGQTQQPPARKLPARQTNQPPPPRAPAGPTKQSLPPTPPVQTKQPASSPPVSPQQQLARKRHHENTVHHLIPTAKMTGDPKYRAWNKYMKGEQAAAELKHKSWTEPLSVVLPGQAPKPQIFGPAKEPMIHGGRAMPILYHEPVFKTPEEIEDMEQELYRARYDKLLRAEQCQICQHVFQAGALHDKERAAHIQEHQQALQSAGSCPMCDYQGYQLLTRDQKRAHIESFHLRETLSITGSSQSFLVNRPPYDPKEVCYCFKCGSNMKGWLWEQKQDHTKWCKGSSKLIDHRASEIALEREEHAHREGELKTEIQGLNVQIEELKAQIQKGGADNQSLQVQLSNSKSQTARAEEDRKEIERLRSENESLKKRSFEIERPRETASRLKAQAIEIETLKAENASLKVLESNRQIEHERPRETASRLKAQAIEIETLKAENASLKALESNRKIEHASEIAKLKAENASLKALASNRQPEHGTEQHFRDEICPICAENLGRLGTRTLEEVGAHGFEHGLESANAEFKRLKGIINGLKNDLDKEKQLVHTLVPEASGAGPRDPLDTDKIADLEKNLEATTAGLEIARNQIARLIAANPSLEREQELKDRISDLEEELEKAHEKMLIENHKPGVGEGQDAHRITALEEELEATKDKLSRTLHELDDCQKERKALQKPADRDEELRRKDEELFRIKEELSWTKDKKDELSKANDELLKNQSESAGTKTGSSRTKQGAFGTPRGQRDTQSAQAIKRALDEIAMACQDFDRETIELEDLQSRLEEAAKEIESQAVAQLLSSGHRIIMKVFGPADTSDASISDASAFNASAFDPSATDANTSNANASDAKQCPLCDHVYEEDFNNYARYQHFYDFHIFTPHTKKPESKEPKHEHAKAQVSAYEPDDINKDLGYWWRRQPQPVDTRKPFWHPCRFPSNPPCEVQFNANEYMRVEDLRKAMTEHTDEKHAPKEHGMKLKVLRPDWWACKICVWDDNSRFPNMGKDDPDEPKKPREEDKLVNRNKYSEYEWLRICKDHIELKHKDIYLAGKIGYPEKVYISYHTWREHDEKDRPWDWGYYKRKYENYETTTVEERGRTFWDVRADAKGLGDHADEEEPVDEEPVDEEPVDEEPVDEEPGEEEPVEEQDDVEEGDNPGDDGEGDEGDEAAKKGVKRVKKGPFDDDEDSSKTSKFAIIQYGSSSSPSNPSSTSPDPEPHQNQGETASSTSWTCPICSITINSEEDDNYSKNYIKRIISHYPTHHSNHSPYIHKCHLCSHVFRTRKPSDGSFDPAPMEKHYNDVHRETVHRELPHREMEGNGQKTLRWCCPVCWRNLHFESHVHRLEHLERCDSAHTSELDMVALTLSEAKSTGGNVDDEALQAEMGLKPPLSKKRGSEEGDEVGKKGVKRVRRGLRSGR